MSDDCILFEIVPNDSIFSDMDSGGSSPQPEGGQVHKRQRTEGGLVLSTTYPLCGHEALLSAQANLFQGVVERFQEVCQISEYSEDYFTADDLKEALGVPRLDGLAEYINSEIERGDYKLPLRSSENIDGEKNSFDKYVGIRFKGSREPLSTPFDPITFRTPAGEREYYRLHERFKYLFLIVCPGEKIDKVASHRIEEYLGNMKDIKRYLKIIGKEHMIEFKEAKPTEEPDIRALIPALLDNPDVKFEISRGTTTRSGKGVMCHHGVKINSVLRVMEEIYNIVFLPMTLCRIKSALLLESPVDDINVERYAKELLVDDDYKYSKFESISEYLRGIVMNESPNEILSFWLVVLLKREKVVYDKNHTKGPNALFSINHLLGDFIKFMWRGLYDRSILNREPSKYFVNRMMVEVLNNFVLGVSSTGSMENEFLLFLGKLQYDWRIEDFGIDLRTVSYNGGEYEKLKLNAVLHQLRIRSFALKAEKERILKQFRADRR
jgi:hypothetical protein